MLPQVIRNPSCALWMEPQFWNILGHLKPNSDVSFQACSRSSHRSLCRVIVERPRFEIKLETEICSWVSVNKQLPRFAAGLGGARCPGAVGAILAGTSGYYNPPGTVAMNCAAAAPEVCWSGCSEECCCPRLRARAVSCRPWSRWRWDCAPREPHRFCTASWTWISGSGTRSWPTNHRVNINITPMCALKWLFYFFKEFLHLFKK